jgi:hypothetical protein
MIPSRATGLLLALLSLAACHPDFRGSVGGPARTAFVTVDNPFLCPKAERP